MSESVEVVCNGCTGAALPLRRLFIHICIPGSCTVVPLICGWMPGYCAHEGLACLRGWTPHLDIRLLYMYAHVWPLSLLTCVISKPQQLSMLVSDKKKQKLTEGGLLGRFKKFRLAP